MGEGGAFFICKRLEDAEKAGDKIYAVIRGVGGASDGKGKGITAPNPIGQRLAIQRAWKRAGLDPATMTLLEGHGTSTRVGDVAEMESVAGVLAEGTPVKHMIALGSVKSQIGHLKSAAGAAGLLKAVLACHHKILPPSINFDVPSPNIPFDKIPFEVNTKARPWERPSFAPRRCGVSAFGFGGTNFHVVVEEYVPGMLTAPADHGAGAAADNRVGSLPALLAADHRGRVWEPSQGSHLDNRVGSRRFAAADQRGRVWEPSQGSHLDNRVGSRPALPAADQRGRVWEPSQGSHLDNRVGSRSFAAADQRGRVWEPSQGSHLDNRVGSRQLCRRRTSREGLGTLPGFPIDRPCSATCSRWAEPTSRPCADVLARLWRTPRPARCPTALRQGRISWARRCAWSSPSTRRPSWSRSAR